MTGRRILIAATGAVLALGLSACSSSDGAASSDDPSTTTSPASELPTGVTGPITGGTYGIPYLAMPEGWEEEFGYTEAEYFVEGDAVSYASDGPLADDGAWDVSTSTETAPFATRMVIRRPADDADFNGTVLVEWLNVSAGRDSDPDFGFLASHLMDEGYAYVGISAQRTGVEPGGLGLDIPGVPPEALAPLKEWDPERYASLSHPGDDYSFDIFTQATTMALAPGTPLGGLDVEHVVAAGESQSAGRMVTYIDAVQPVTERFDGFLVHSRGSTGSDLNETPDGKAPAVTPIRADVAVPVFQFETETDLDFLRFRDARQDDAENLVTWETAGTAHADRSTLDYGVLAGGRWTDANVDLSTACGEVNDGPQEAILQAGFASLVTWIADGTRPPASPRLELDASGEIVRDELGIAVGGIRTPPVDAPTYVLTGKNESPNIICVLFGAQTPLTDDQLAARYPDHDAYVADVEASASAALADGYLLEDAAEAFTSEAGSADVP